MGFGADGVAGRWIPIKRYPRRCLGASTPLRGYIPKMRAGVVETNSTERLIVSFP